ncbi:MAG: hypothetical protein ABIN48_11380 [Ginsengibacter sp.]
MKESKFTDFVFQYRSFMGLSHAGKIDAFEITDYPENQEQWKSRW